MNTVTERSTHRGTYDYTTASGETLVFSTFDFELDGEEIVLRAGYCVERHNPDASYFHGTSPDELRDPDEREGWSRQEWDEAQAEERAGWEP